MGGGDRGRGGEPERMAREKRRGGKGRRGGREKRRGRGRKKLSSSKVGGGSLGQRTHTIPLMGELNCVIIPTYTRMSRIY